MSLFAYPSKPKNLEIINPHETPQPWENPFRRFLFFKKVFQHLLTALASRNELRVWQTSSRGNTQWHAYDPRTDRSICVASEAEIRYWIEQNYYQESSLKN